MLWILPLLLLAAGTAAAWVFNLDLSISRLVYVPGAAQPWPIGNTDVARFLERWVWVPAAALTAAAAVLIAAGVRRRQRPLLRAGLILLLSLALGPLFLVNTVIRPHFGRPRPQDVTEFGGSDRLHPVLWPSFGEGAGFPSGHAAAAFALLLPFFALRRISRRLALAALLAGLAYGWLIGFVRIAHGRHFFTDVLWSGGIVWFSGYAATALLEWVLPPESLDSRAEGSARSAAPA